MRQKYAKTTVVHFDPLAASALGSLIMTTEMPAIKAEICGGKSVKRASR
jgi:hypothetical protein